MKREPSEEFKGYKEWRNGSQQWIHTKPGETRADVIGFMYDSLEQYGRTDLTFIEKDVRKAGPRAYVVTLIEKVNGAKASNYSGDSVAPQNGFIEPDEV